MMIEEMSDAECRTMLEAAQVARLGCALNGQPYIVPIHVQVEGNFVYGYATLGQKIEWMRQNPQVCLEVDDLATAAQWASLVIVGHYEELPHAVEYKEERLIAERLFQKRPMWWEPASVPLAGHVQRVPVVFRIRIDRITGRRTRPTAHGGA
jgi:nitroimidazol reductase NimA-like FMN-containing flavoprotein (pyridoxamine 5'-phosphate oxidase superfamily)